MFMRVRNFSSYAVFHTRTRIAAYVHPRREVGLLVCYTFSFSEIPGSSSYMQIKRVGVVGAGTMGNGIAHVFARSGYAVTLYDVCLLYTSPSPRDS